MTTHNLPSAGELAARLGLRAAGRSWRGECPSCQYPGTFCIKPGRDGRLHLFCASCGDRQAVREAVDRQLGGHVTPTTAPQRPDGAAGKAARHEAALRCWNGASAVPATPAAVYLASRSLQAYAASSALRWRRDVSHPEARGLWPAMVAAVSAPDGSFLGAHRTYLRPDGAGKAEVEPAKATLGPCWGGAVRLNPTAADGSAMPQLVIGEGIESSAAAGLLLRFPAWAAISTGNLASGLVLPPAVRSIIIAADHDLPTRDGRRPGQDAAEAAARRWRGEGGRFA